MPAGGVSNEYGVPPDEGIVRFRVIATALLVAVVAISCGRDTPLGRSRTTEPTVFVFVQIPESIRPLEDPLDASLKAANLGEVTGGGSQLGEMRKDGTAGIEWVGIDVELTDLERGLPFLKSELLRLGAPATTVLEFNRAGTKVKEHIK